MAKRLPRWINTSINLRHNWWNIWWIMWCNFRAQTNTNENSSLAYASIRHCWSLFFSVVYVFTIVSHSFHYTFRKLIHHAVPKFHHATIHRDMTCFSWMSLIFLLARRNDRMQMHRVATWLAQWKFQMHLEHFVWECTVLHYACLAIIQSRDTCLVIMFVNIHRWGLNCWNRYM